MNEADFDRLLDAVTAAMALDSEGETMVQKGTDRPKGKPQPSSAANDNQKAWPLVPFPEGWSASC